MSEPQSIAGVQASRPASGDVGVRAAIARAAQATGVDFNYLLAQAKLESSLNPSASASTSSAAGLYQFTRGTWLNTLERHGASHGMDWADAAIDSGRVTDPSLRSQIMAMRYDPNTSAMMAAELANDNKTELTTALGREPDSAELYMAHFLGSAGAKDFLTALSLNPGVSAASILPKAAAANRSIFFDASGAPRSVSGVMDLMRNKVMSAMGGSGLPAMDYAGLTDAASTDMGQLVPAPMQQLPQVTGGPIAQEFAAARQGMADAGPARTSMADTLRNAFASTGAATGSDAQTGVPDFVRAAYGQFQKFGM